MQAVKFSTNKRVLIIANQNNKSNGNKTNRLRVKLDTIQSLGSTRCIQSKRAQGKPRTHMSRGEWWKAREWTDKKNNYGVQF